MNVFAKNIEFLRKKRGLSQAGMLAVLDIPRTTWISYENGKSEPDMDRIIKIAAYFKVGVTEIMTLNLSANTHLIENEPPPGIHTQLR